MQLDTSVAASGHKAIRTADPGNVALANSARACSPVSDTRRWSVASLLLVAVVLLVTSCESRYPVGSVVPDLQMTATQLAEVTAVPTSAPVVLPEIVFVALSAQLQERDANSVTLVVDLAVENHSSEWVVVEAHQGSRILSAEGDVAELTWSGAPGEIPPGFRSRVCQDRQPLRVTGHMPAASSEHQLDLVFSAYPADLDVVDDGYRGVHQLLAASPKATALSYPFLNRGGWEAYRQQYADQMIILEPGGLTSPPFGVLTFKDVRYLPEGGPTERYQFRFSLANASIYQLLLELEGDAWPSSGFTVPAAGSCHANWGQSLECIVRSETVQVLADDPGQVCLLVRDPRWSLRGTSDQESLGKPLLACYP